MLARTYVQHRDKIYHGKNRQITVLTKNHELCRARLTYIRTTKNANRKTERVTKICTLAISAKDVECVEGSEYEKKTNHKNALKFSFRFTEITNEKDDSAADTNRTNQRYVYQNDISFSLHVRMFPSIRNGCTLYLYI